MGINSNGNVNGHSEAYKDASESSEATQTKVRAQDMEDFVRCEIPLLDSSGFTATKNGVDTTELLILAWVLVLYRYDGTDDIIFTAGCQQACSSAPTSSTDSITVDRTANALTLLESVRKSGSSLEISRKLAGGDVHYLFFNNATESGDANWTVQLDARIVDGALWLKYSWRSQFVAESVAINYRSALVDTLSAVLRDQTSNVVNIISIKPQELETVWAWNAELPPTIDDCIQDIVSKQCRAIPDHQAVESWDGKLTYRQVDYLSNQVAAALLAVDRNLDIVPLCFEKSMWTVVAVLGALKAGAAFALMDPSQPELRLRSIVTQVEAKVILASKAQSDLASRLAGDAPVIIVAPGLPEPSPEMELPTVPGSAKCYLQFTSGSTGTPKGVVITHTNFTSGALPRSEIMEYLPTSRVLDFPSYAFDVSIDCMLCTLARGGVICVPSDEARVNDLAGSIRKMKVNMAVMTPSVARLLDDDTLSLLTVMGLGGETVTSGDASKWSKLTRIVIAYGPSECTVGCTVNGNVVPQSLNSNIGKGVGGVMWIVDPNNHDRLLPAGATGELLVEGPIVGEGYLKNPEKTAEVFISDPKWLLAGSKTTPGRSGRLYKTGDLVKFDADGSIIFQGRKDTQVKLRGQRVELSEIEHHLRLALPTWVELSAEVITPNAPGAKATLVAFISGHPPDTSNGFGKDGSPDQLFATGVSQPLAAALVGIETRIAENAPVYMIPSAYIPVIKMPLMVSKKLDRKTLKAAASALSPREIAAFRIQSANVQAPGTDLESSLQAIWSKLLGIDSSRISVTDNFFSLGGDSIMVIKMVAAARTQGLTLRAHEVLGMPTLQRLALTITRVAEDETLQIAPLSILAPEWKDIALEETAELCSVEATDIEDIYPCTPLQEGLIALSAKRTEAYVAQRVVEIPDKAAETRLRAAWESVVAATMILRTRIIYVPSQGLMQVVIKSPISWRSGETLDQYIESDRKDPMQLGSELARYGIVKDKSTGKQHFIWSIHHALYDGWSLPRIMERVRRTYQGLSTTQPTEFRTFIKYLNDSDQKASRSFWRRHLKGANVPQFPPFPSVGYEPKADSLLERRVSLLKSNASSTTSSTIIRAAWAIVTARLTGSDDVVFGETLVGRNIPITGVDELEGPMITTVPVRIQLNRATPIDVLLKNIHNDGITRIHHEHLGLQHIRRISLDAQVASDLRTGLVIQPGAIDNPNSEEFGDGLAGLAPKSDLEAAKEALHFNSYALMLVCSLESDNFLIMASFDSNVINVPKMERILEDFDAMIQRLLPEGNLPVEKFLGARQAEFQPSLPNNGVRKIEKLAESPRVSETQMEAMLQKVYSNTIGIDVSEVGTNDDFFSLGGDSITAMKLVALVKAEGYTMTVADVFRQPTLCDLAKHLASQKATGNSSVSSRSTTNAVAAKPQVAEIPNAPFSALNLQQLFISEVVRPLLADPSWKVKDVLPLTNDQEMSVKGTIAAPRFSIQYNLMYLDQAVDRKLLLENWRQLIAHHEILRTIFVQIAGQFLQVVLEELLLPVEEYETAENIDEFTRKICEYDSQCAMQLGSPFLKFIFITSSTPGAQNCLAIRMSHSQYDGISLPNLFLELQALYAGKPIAPSPGMSSYIYHMNQKSHLEHWRQELRGSQLSILGTYLNRPDVSPNAAFVTTSIDISARPKEITTATFLSAGWALTLAKHLKTRDVTFGHIVAARSIDVPDAGKILGMCDNHLPLRVVFKPQWTALQYLRSVQTQRAVNSPFEHTQFRDIVLNCTEWTEQQELLKSGKHVTFDNMVHHQDIEYFDTMPLGDTETRLDVWNPSGEPAMEWKVQSFLKDGKFLEVEIMCSETFKALAETLIESLKSSILGMIDNPQGLLF